MPVVLRQFEAEMGACETEAGAGNAHHQLCAHEPAGCVTASRTIEANSPSMEAKGAVQLRDQGPAFGEAPMIDSPSHKTHWAVPGLQVPPNSPLGRHFVAGIVDVLVAFLKHSPRGTGRTSNKWAILNSLHAWMGTRSNTCRRPHI